MHCTRPPHPIPAVVVVLVMVADDDFVDVCVETGGVPDVVATVVPIEVLLEIDDMLAVRDADKAEAGRAEASAVVVPGPADDFRVGTYVAEVLATEMAVADVSTTGTSTCEVAYRAGGSTGPGPAVDIRAARIFGAAACGVTVVVVEPTVEVVCHRLAVGSVTDMSMATIKARLLVVVGLRLQPRRFRAHPDGGDVTDDCAIFSVCMGKMQNAEIIAAWAC